MTSGYGEGNAAPAFVPERKQTHKEQRRGGRSKEEEEGGGEEERKELARAEDEKNVKRGKDDENVLNIIHALVQCTAG